MFRIRFHGRGGQGIKTAAQILGRAFFLAGFEVQDAPRYGAERRGAPMFAYVRASHLPIKERGVIGNPDLVVVADETLVPLPVAGVMQGLGAETLLVIRSDESADTWRQRLGLRSPVLTLPAGATAAHDDLPQVGAACVGAAAALLAVVRPETLAAAIRAETERFGERMMAKNLLQASAAYELMAHEAGRVKEGGRGSARDYQAPEWIDLPREGVSAASPDIHGAATSLLVNTGLWRTTRPVIDYALCNRCSWICGSLCPDSAITVAADRKPTIDYDHCKGCLVCVAVCPPHAIQAVPEKAPAAERLS